jgi:hypothetical protein
MVGAGAVVALPTGTPGDAVIINSTIDGNAITGTSGDSRGGGLGLGPGGSAGTISLTNVTISGNSAASGSAIDVEYGPVHLKSTIVQAPTQPACSFVSAGSSIGQIVSDGDNLDSGNSCGLNRPSDLHDVDPMLGPLQNNGGPTPTRSLLPGSPAIDAVLATDCPPPAVDQRGVTRPQGPRCDIGAYELRQRGHRHIPI